MLTLKKRPSAGELCEIIYGWVDYWGEIKKNTPFYHQYQSLEQEYNTFSQNTPYQIHPTVITTSKMIDTKQITQLLQNYQASRDLSLDINNYLTELNIPEEPVETSTQFNKSTGLTRQFKRQLSLDTQTKTTQGESKEIKLESQSEPMEMDNQEQSSHQAQIRNKQL